nr:DUF1861 family protein [Candidatus Levybacteria bacterium]
MVESALMQESFLNPSEEAGLIEFEGVKGKFVFNITAPFEYNGEILIAGRIQSSRDESLASTIGIFRQTGDSSFAIRNIFPAIGLEDPFVTSIKDNLILGCVQTYRTDENGIGYRTLFYKNPDLDNLDLEHEPFAIGPDGMKDIRLVELKDKKIGVFTRLQGAVGGKGKIGFTILNSLDELNKDTITAAPLINVPFKDGEWGGVNAAYLLEDGRIGALCHIASVDDKGKHYSAISFIFNPDIFEVSPPTVIASRQDFPIGNFKDDIVFPGGLTTNGNGEVTLWAGLSDAESGSIVIPNPFV